MDDKQGTCGGCKMRGLGEGKMLEYLRMKIGIKREQVARDEFHGANGNLSHTPPTGNFRKLVHKV